MLKQIRLELFKLTRRSRSYIGFAALLGITGLVTLGFKNGPPPFQEMTAPPGFVTVGSVLNGGLVAWFLLRFMIEFFLPLFVCVVVGDLISGEAAEGTLKSMLSRPISRGRLYSAKLMTAVIYTAALTLFLGLASYVVGAVFLGRGALMTFQWGGLFEAQGVFVYSEGEGLVRMLLAYAFAALAVLTVGSIAFFISTLVTNSLGAIGGAMIVYIVLRLVGVIGYFDPIEPYLFTTYMGAFEGFFIDEIPWLEIGKYALILLTYSAAFAGAGFLIFRRKDVLS
ncbi:MAG: ABC transporter permease [Armatimonadota bacterium]